MQDKREADALLRQKQRKAEREERRKNRKRKAAFLPEIQTMGTEKTNFTDQAKTKFRTENGLNENTVRQIAKEKNEPDWMLENRLKALKLYEELPNPIWGPDISAVDMNQIAAYVRPDAQKAQKWDDVPEEIRDTFVKLGVPDEEIKYLSGLGAQYDSEIVYHNLKDYLLDQGVIYTDMDSGVKEYPDLVREHFSKLISPSLHKYAALHYAVWSGGAFIYVPEGVDVDIPLQSYYRFNAAGAGQFEHTLIIVEKNASVHFIEGCSAPKYNVVNLHAGAVEIFIREGGKMRFSTIENWAKNMYNLGTKRALVEKNGKMEWISGSFGSACTMLYPASILVGEGASSEYTGITFASKGQELDTGAQVMHYAPNTYSTINSKSIVKDGGKAYYRGTVDIGKNAQDAKCSTSCESLILDTRSHSTTIPSIRIANDSVDMGHEAKIGRIDEETIFYLMSRGIPEEEAKAMIVRGFAEPITKELPMEYAVEMNNLINLEVKGAIG